MPDSFRVEVHGLRELRRDLRQIEAATPREIRQGLGLIVQPIRARAAALAPRRSGALADSLEAFTRGTRVGVRSKLPYANVVHWGGTIYPRGVPIRFERTEFISRAAEGQAELIGERVLDQIDGLLRRNGFK